MKPIKQIPRPQLNGARRLSALQLNRIAYEERHSVLTPDQLQSLAASAEAASGSSSGSSARK
ncbi:MAG: hypothetical protein HDS53_00545 [Barnesiella sp.]|nr:hypothetical protein [Barnesiella sp.]